ncbi:MAG: hypothetical protein WCW25_02865 [Patescibacteria group bacterium]
MPTRIFFMVSDINILRVKIPLLRGVSRFYRLGVCGMVDVRY